MSTTHQHDADRETLSALFDGELQGDAARFAVKRLDHDVQWRETFGRWQLLGDALRGQATAAAPRGFADRVGLALADENAAVATAAAAPGTHAAPTRRRWVGGAALVASVALAALFVTRPFSPTDVAPSPTPQIAASAQPAAPAPAAQPPATPAPVLPGAEEGFAAATMAVADASRRASERRARAQGQTLQDTAPARELIVAAAPTAIASAADTAPSAIESSPSPFLPQDEIASRPWPRAALPNYPAGNALTAGFDSRAGIQPRPSSFYPFEPRMLGADQPPASTQGDATRDAPGQGDPAPDASNWPRR